MRGLAWPLINSCVRTVLNPDAVAETAQAVRSAVLDSDTGFVVMGPASTLDMIATRALLAVAGDRPVVIVNPRFEMEPVEMSSFNCVFAISPFKVLVTRSDAPSPGSGDGGGLDSTPELQPSLVVLKRFGRDWELFIDPNKGGYNFAGTFPTRPTPAMLAKAAGDAINRLQVDAGGRMAQSLDSLAGGSSKADDTSAGASAGAAGKEGSDEDLAMRESIRQLNRIFSKAMDVSDMDGSFRDAGAVSSGSPEDAFVDPVALLNSAFAAPSLDEVPGDSDANGDGDLGLDIASAGPAADVAFLNRALASSSSDEDDPTGEGGPLLS